MANSCIIMKFGGTSVGDAKAIERVAAIVRGRLQQGPVIVVSAMARVTDQLLRMARAAGSGDRKTALTLARELRERHYNTAGELLGTALFTQFHGDLGAEFEELEELLRGIAAVGELTPRTTDHVASFGEVLSSKLVTAALSAHGIEASLVDARDCIVTDETFTRAAPLFEDTNAKLGELVRPLLEQRRVPVMGGFIATTRITIVDVAAPRMLLAHGFLKSIFEAFDRHRIPVDVVSTSEVSVSLTVDSNESIPALAADLAKLADVKYEGRKAIVCLVGENLRETPGIAARVFGELSDVKIRMISQGASEINLTFVVEEDVVLDVVRRLHKTFFSDLDVEVFA